MMERGIYKAKVIALFYSESKKKGTPCMVATIDLGEDTTRAVYFYLSEAAWEYSAPKLERIAWNGETEEGKVSWDKEGEYEWECRHEDYEGKPQEKWDFAGGGAQPKPIAPDKAAVYRARFNANGKTATPAPRPATPPKPAPTNAGPPARPTPPTKPAEKDDWSHITDKATAYEDLVRSNSNEKPDVINKRWFTALDMVEQKAGKKEADFTAEDWREVIRSVPPF